MDLNPSTEITTTSQLSLVVDQSNEALSSHENNEPIAIRKGTRKCFKDTISYYISFNKCSTAHRSFLTTLNNISIPHTLSEALSNENWKQAMNVEMQALERRIRHGSL